MRYSYSLGALLACVLVSVACSSVPLPPQAIALNNAGAQALAEGDLETADARLSVALEYSPEFVDALVNLGLVECQRGNFARAHRLLTRARRLNPDVAQPHHALGVLAERERDPARARAHYREALRVDPGFAPARANLGRIQFDHGEYEASYLTFKKLVEVAPDSAEAYVGLGESLTRLARYAEADAIASAATERFPDDPGVRLIEAQRLLRAGDADATLRCLLPLFTRRDDYAAAALGWGAAADFARGDALAARERALDALALRPDEPVARSVLRSLGAER